MERRVNGYKCSDDIDDDERDVVLLGCGLGLPVAYLGEKAIGDFDGSMRPGGAKNLLESRIPESSTGRVLGLDDAIGIEDQAISAGERDVGFGVLSVRQYTEQEPIALD